MAKPQLLYYATDKDLFDALVSARQQFGEAALLNLARTRGIYYSEQEDRVTLADNVSLLTFGFHEVSAIQAEFERSGRGEKTASFRMKTALTLDEIKAITGEYIKAAVSDGERLSSHLIGESGFALDVKYNELDLSRTSLRQVQKKEAHIEVKVVGDETVVTFPSNVKAESIARAITKRVNAVRSSVVDIEEIDFSGFSGPKAKTEFFYRLVTTLPDFKMVDVTNIKVDSSRDGGSPPSGGFDELGEASDDQNGEDSSDQERIAQEMLGIVRAVALHGKSLLSSREYQSLQRRGFFISKIQWSAKRLSSPFQVVEFDASFTDPLVGTGFRYAVRGWSTQKNGEYTKGFNVIPDDEKQLLMQLLEQRGMSLYKELRSEMLASSASANVPTVAADTPDEGGGVANEEV